MRIVWSVVLLEYVNPPTYRVYRNKIGKAARKPCRRSTPARLRWQDSPFPPKKSKLSLKAKIQERQSWEGGALPPACRKEHVWYQSTGILNYDNDTGWIVLRVHPSIGRYYGWWVQRLTGKKGSSPLHDYHVTVVGGKYEDTRKSAEWGLYRDKRVDFEYSNIIEADEHYYWLPIQCPFLEKVRLGLGLKNPRPLWKFHLTVLHIT